MAESLAKETEGREFVDEYGIRHVEELDPDTCYEMVDLINREGVNAMFCAVDSLEESCICVSFDEFTEPDEDGFPIGPSFTMWAIRDILKDYIRVHDELYAMLHNKELCRADDDEYDGVIHKLEDSMAMFRDSVMDWPRKENNVRSTDSE